MNKKTIKDIDVKNKTVLVRADFNVPIENGKILDDFKIKKSLDTINYLVKKNAKVVLMSHLGKPKGKVVEELRLDPIAKSLSQMLGRKVEKLDDCIGQEVNDKVKKARFGEVILLENVRFYPEEEKCDLKFAKKLASLGEIFCVDGFGSVHRAHASVTGVAKFLPAVAGLLLEKEVDVLTEVLEKPEHPYLVILGGAKISTKLNLINKLAKQADKLLVAGALSNTIFMVNGLNVGGSMVEKKEIPLIKETVLKNTNIDIPIDVTVGKDNGDGTRIVDIGNGINSDEFIYDIGPKTIDLFKRKIDKARLLVWNGPMGKFENEKYAKGTDELARELVKVKKAVVGGGETSMAIRKLGLEDKIYFLSTGGGAMLEFLEGKTMPGIECLLDK
ncbi:MAG: phosphoglycerate kinase [Patescibacteria group bacterium]|nr:phosphoglycerate kinase [Patescibacteria group bacterium]